MAIALCFMVAGRFHAAPLWRAWLQRAVEDGVKVDVTVHASSLVDDAEDRAVTEWCRAVGGRRLPSRATAWASPQVLAAELDMLDVVPGAASHALLLSQDCVPLLTAAQLVRVCAVRYAGKSACHFSEYSSRPCAFLRDAAQALLDYDGISLFYASQFLLVCMRQYRRIAARARRLLVVHCSNEAAWVAAVKRGTCMSPDEWVLQSLLLHEFGEAGLVFGPVVDAVFPKGGIRAVARSRAWIGRHLAARAADAQAQGYPVALRKVRDADGALEAAAAALQLPL